MEIQPYYPQLPHGRMKFAVEKIGRLAGRDLRESRVFIEDETEEVIIRDAIARLGMFTYLRQVRELSRKGAEDYPKVIVFSNRQLKHIQKRVAPWEKHHISTQDEKTIKVAHGVAITIANYLGNPPKLAKGG